MTQNTGRHRNIIAVAASVVLALIGTVVLFLAMGAAESPPQPSTITAQTPASPTVTTEPAPKVDSAKGPDLGPILKESRPVGIDIPSIGVRTKNFVDLDQDAKGVLEVPTDYSAVGWYRGGTSPGQLGPAILVGHVDSKNGPAIFYKLGALKPGAKIKIARKDGSTATFQIDRIRTFAKNKFPTNEIYGATDRAELRLITCGGTFDPRTGHYDQNVIAFAHLI